MSILLRTSLSAVPAHKLTFVQYLAGLAMVEACRDDTVLGIHGACVRLKWPNDVYAVMNNTVAESKKIGGVLVNCNFGAGKVEIVVG